MVPVGVAGIVDTSIYPSLIILYHRTNRPRKQSLRQSERDTDGTSGCPRDRVHQLYYPPLIISYIAVEPSKQNLRQRGDSLDGPSGCRRDR